MKNHEILENHFNNWKLYKSAESLGILFEHSKENIRHKIKFTEEIKKRYFEDAYQDKYIDALKKGSYRNKTNYTYFKNSLKTSISNRIKDILKKPKNNTDELENSIMQIPIEKYEDYSVDNLIAHLSSFLDKKGNNVLELIIKGFKIVEISEILEISEPTVRQKRKKIRNILSKYYPQKNWNGMTNLSENNLPFWKWIVFSFKNDSKINLILFFILIGFIGIFSPVFLDNLDYENIPHLIHIVAIVAAIGILTNHQIRFSRWLDLNHLTNKVKLKLDYFREYKALQQFTFAVFLTFVGWLILYSTVFIGNSLFANSNETRAFSHLANNISSVFIWFCYITMTRITIRIRDDKDIKDMKLIKRLVAHPSKISKQNIIEESPWALKKISIISITLVLVFSFEILFIENIFLSITIGLFSSLFSIVSLCLVSTSLANPLLGVPKLVIIILFSYVGIQILSELVIINNASKMFSADFNSSFLQLKSSIIYFALLSKMLLFITFLWLLKSNRLAHLFYVIYRSKDFFDKSRFVSINKLSK